MPRRKSPGTIQQGDIWWFEFAAPDKARPVVILTRTGVIPYIERVTVAPITTRLRGLPSEVLLNMDDGMSVTCAVGLDNIQTVPKAQLRDFVNRLNVERMREVRNAVEFAFGFDLLD
jgi:mRNA interferase MazF